MITDKILVFAPNQYNINGGGPSGFIAHNLLDKPREYFLLSEEIFTGHFNKNNYLSKLVFRLNKDMHALFNKKNYFVYRNYFKKIQAYRYKYIYFHECIIFEFCKDLISSQQIVILQSHSPELPSVEYMETFPEDKKGLLIRIKAERNAFKWANIVVFPNPGCLPIYESILPNTANIYYMISGAKSNYNVVEKYDLEYDKINLLYLGRRNKIKGFDIVLNSFREARKKNSNLQLYIIGKGEEIIEDGIIDIGFTKDPISWYNSVDYLINANRQSYFDLSIIEALSTGVPIIMSNNFGHSYFENKSSLIHTFDINNKDALTNILSGKLRKRDYSKIENKIIYEEELSDSCYYDRFVDFVKFVTK